MPNQSKQRGIPTYLSNGHRVSDSSVERVERLLSLKMVSVRRNARTGHMTHCQFLAETLRGPNPIRKSAQMGQHYCVRRNAGNHQVWTHRDLRQFVDPGEMGRLLAEAERHNADLFVRRVFLNVPLSCMSCRPEPEPPRTPRANVIPFPVRKPVSAIAGERKAA